MSNRHPGASPRGHPATPTAEHVLRDEIDQIATQLDRRLNCPPGTALSAIYLWFWPPEDCGSEEVLTALHGEAVGHLHRLTTGKP